MQGKPRNPIGSLFGLRRARPGDRPSANAQNQLVDAVQAAGSLRAVAPLWMKKAGTGFHIGITLPRNGGLLVPARIAGVRIRGDEVLEGQVIPPSLGQDVEYKVRVCKGGPALPGGVDPATWYRARYGRPATDDVRINPARVGDLCEVSMSETSPSLVELSVRSETLAAKRCGGTASASVVAGIAAAANVRSAPAAMTPSQEGDPVATTFQKMPAERLDAAIQEAWTKPQYVGDVDFAAYSFWISDGTLKTNWTGLEAVVQASADGRNWYTALHADGVSAVTITADGTIPIDCRRSVGWLRAGWSPGSSPKGAGSEVEVGFSKKRSN